MARPAILRHSANRFMNGYGGRSAAKNCTDFELPLVGTRLTVKALVLDYRITGKKYLQFIAISLNYLTTLIFFFFIIPVVPYSGLLVRAISFNPAPLLAEWKKVVPTSDHHVTTFTLFLSIRQNVFTVHLNASFPI